MTSSLITGLANHTNKTRTENGAVTNRSTHSALLDFFALAGAMRDRPQEAVRLFKRACIEDKLYAIRSLFYLRDVRGGQGERDTFRACFRTLSTEDIAHLAPLVAEYGRWDDIIEYVDNPAVVNLIAEQIVEDTNAKKGLSISLLGKWLPSVNASSDETKALGRKWAKALGITQQDYRKIVGNLRSRIKLLEHSMSKREWEAIEYKRIPSQAFRKHVKAFRRNDTERFEQFITKVEKGEEKVHADTLYPYEIFEQINSSNAREMNILWEALPDYTQGHNALVMADVSGSMGMYNARPLATSVSLALYFAQRNKGLFHGCFMTFAGQPDIIQLPENLSLENALTWIASSDHRMQNTNLQAGFEAILNVAIANEIPEEEMPRTLYIISDMEFDCCGGTSNLEAIRLKYANAGYLLPQVVFWNVAARNTQVPATADDSCVSLVSGSSASTFKLAVEGKTPAQTMIDLLDSDRYATINLEV